MTITRQLHEGARKFALPAELALAGGDVVRCTEVLRVLPGKRLVMRATWRERPVLVKLICDSASGRRNMRRELAGHRVLKDAAIATPDLLWSGRCMDGGHVLLFAFLAAAQNLADVWRENLEQRAQSAAAALEMMASLHRKSCEYTDPHLQNFLHLDNQLYAVDAESLKAHPRTIYGKWQRKNLAQFIAPFPPPWRKNIRQLLAAHYQEAAVDEKLDAAIAHAVRRHQSRYLKKCFRECSEFCVRKNWRRRMVWRRSCHSAALDSLLDKLEHWINQGDSIPASRGVSMARITINDQPFIIRRSSSKTIYPAASQAHTLWRQAQQKKLHGMANPQSIAFVEKRWGPFCYENYYVCAGEQSSSE